MSSLKARLQNPDYINWVKAGLCLIHTKSGLEDFADSASQSLHQSILTNIIPKFANTAKPVCGIVISKQKLNTTCTDQYCQGFLSALIINGMDPTHAYTVRHGNLANCNIGQWHTHHWQVAKLFMNHQGQQLPTQVKSSQTDMSGVLNFLSHCRVPRRKLTNVLLLDDVRKARNDIMHTADMTVSAADLQTYVQAMIDLLNDPGISCFPAAQLAVAEIQTLMKSAEFQITLEDEGKVMDQLAAAIRTMTEDIRCEVEAVAECGEVQRKAIKEQLHNEIKKVSSCYAVLNGMVESNTESQKEMEDKITNLKDQLGKVTEDLRTFEINVSDIERQLQNLAKQQETNQQTVDDHTIKIYATDQALEDLRTNFQTSRIQTKQDLDEMRATHEVYRNQTNQKFDENTNAHISRIPTDEDKKRLREYLQSTYKDGRFCKVAPLPDWVGLAVTDIFTPVVLVRDSEEKKETLVRDSEDKKETLVRDSEDKKETLVSYNDLFYKEGVPQKKTILLGEPGAGKTTFLKHLTDVWCNPTSKRQFDDVDVFQEYPFLFHISCRSAGKNETILDMIKHQLFDDEEMKDIACNVLKHFSNDCLILIDGFDELQRSALAETGKRGDITGLPSLIGVQNCVLIITSRPWKFFSIPKDEQENFSRMELDGIKNVKELVEILFRKHQVPDPAKASSDFLADINEREMNKLIKYPLMLIFAIDVWVQNMSLPKSVCLCYINMIKLSLERSQTKCEKANMDNTNIVENLLNSSKSEESLPHVFSNFKCVQRHAGLFLSLGHLASDFLLGLKEQMLVFQKDDCEKYKISEDDGSLKLCLDLGILTKLESTVRGIKQKETFQFCHKTFQEFFAALWLSRKYTVEDSQEKLNLHACMETNEDLLNYSVLLNFLCGFNPEAGTHFWTHIAKKNIDIIMIQSIQNLVLNTVKEAHECCDHQGERVYYCLPHVWINNDTSDEDVSLLFKMIIQNNSAYLKYLDMEKNICLLSSQYYSLLSCISSATNLSILKLRSISCQTHDSSDSLPALDLHKHHKLRQLILYKITLSCLLLPNQEETQFSWLHLDKLSMSHDNLVQLCKSLSFLVGLTFLHLNDLSCSDHGGSCPLPVLGLDKHHKLEKLVLQKIPLSCLLLPSQEETQFSWLHLDKLSMSHDNLVQLCKSLSFLVGLILLYLNDLSCSDHDGSCPLSVLGLQRHHKLEKLKLGNTSISGLLLPGQEESRIKVLDLQNLVLSHDSLVQLCSSISSSSVLGELKLTNLRCYDHDDLTNLSCSAHSGRCPLPALGLDRHHELWWLKLDNTSISGLLLPGQEESQIRYLYLYNLVLSHDSLVQLCKSLSFLVGLKVLNLDNISCSDNSGRCPFPVLGLQRHHKLRWLKLDNTSISGLLLPGQEESRIKNLDLHNLVLSHDSLVQLCSLISSSSVLGELKLTNLRCYDHDDLTNLSCSEHSGRCPLPALGLDRHHKLEKLELDNTSISGLLLPGQEESRIEYLYLHNLVLSHDSLVQLCSSISSSSVLIELKLTNLRCNEHVDLTNLSCSEHSGRCRLKCLFLYSHHELKVLSLDKISIRWLLLPSQDGLNNLELNNMVLSHDSLVQLCSSISSSSVLIELKLTNLRCYDHCDLTNLSCSEHSDRCRLKSLNLYSHHELKVLSLDKISISWLLIPSQDELDDLELNNMVLSHDSLVQLCSTLSSLPALKQLKLTNLRCNDHDDRCGIPILDRPKAELENVHMEQIPVEDLSALSGLENLQLTTVPCSEHSVRCNFTVLDLHEHYRLRELKLVTSSISGIILPRPERHIIKAIGLRNLVLSHYSLKQLCTSRSASSAFCAKLHLTNLSCSDHSGSCCFFPESTCY